MNVINLVNHAILGRWKKVDNLEDGGVSWGGLAVIPLSGARQGRVLTSLVHHIDNLIIFLWALLREWTEEVLLVAELAGRVGKWHRWEKAHQAKFVELNEYKAQ